jgi:hypothetical protein
MRYFLMVYDRTAGTILELKEFEGERRAEALKERFARELREVGNSDIEVVVLGAASRNALVHTHSRYFKTLQELAELTPGSP